MAADRKRLREILKKRLSEKRYLHSLAVEERAITLARIHSADEEKAALAGLLHDCCHIRDFGAQLKIIESHAILLDAFTAAQPQLWHAIAGSLYAGDTLGIDDLDILAAIRWHTTGRAGMTRLEQVVYLADLTSADRDFPDIDAVRSLSEQNLAAAMLYALRYTIGMLLEKSGPIVLDAFEAYNYFWNLTNKGD